MVQSKNLNVPTIHQIRLHLRLAHVGALPGLAGSCAGVALRKDLDPGYRLPPAARLRASFSLLSLGYELFRVFIGKTPPV